MDMFYCIISLSLVKLNSDSFWIWIDVTSLWCTILEIWSQQLLVTVSYFILQSFSLDEIRLIFGCADPLTSFQFLCLSYAYESSTAYYFCLRCQPLHRNPRIYDRILLFLSSVRSLTVRLGQKKKPFEKDLKNISFDGNKVFLWSGIHQHQENFELCITNWHGSFFREPQMFLHHRMLAMLQRSMYYK